MATTLTITETSHGQQYVKVKFTLSVAVTSVGTYCFSYGITETGASSTVGSFELIKDTTITESASFYSLQPGTSYTIWCKVINASTGVATHLYTELLVTTAAVVTITYRDGASSSTASGSPLTVSSSGLTSPSGWTFVGWATSTKTNTVAYSGGETITAGSSNQSITLYAVYRYSTSETIYCYFGVGMSSYTPRIRYRWRWNTGTTSYSTSNYTLNYSFLPSFSETTITTTTPSRSWTVLGWRTDTSAAVAQYAGGETLTSSEIAALPTKVYAVYSNTVTIYYNSNGGSGSMSASSATAYYNTSGNYTKPTIPLRTNTFTAPTGKVWKAWCPSADGSGTLYYTEIATNYHITMYAVWKNERPDDWAWTSTVSSGVTVTVTDMKVVFLTAAEWLGFIERIQEFAEYLGVTLTSSYITQATSGVSPDSPMMAVQGNGARLLINQLNPPTATPSALTAGTSGIYPDYLNGLKNSLNSIA